ncbi:hypothetical protein C8Q79DRAFT_751177 [Trametes meyenii]|nr:hypothetical protein C8Q79DRAFT_751177 [Trametes meyenii]
MASTSPHPIAGTYAAIRIDPVATVQDLHDEEALALAQRLVTGTYTIYVEQILELPSLEQPWYLCTVIPLTMDLDDGVHTVGSHVHVQSARRASFPRHGASWGGPHDRHAELGMLLRIRADPQLFGDGRPFTPATMDEAVPGRPWGIDGDNSLNSSYDNQWRLSGTHASIQQKAVRPSPSEIARARMASLSSSSVSWSSSDDANSCSCCRPSEDDLSRGNDAPPRAIGDALSDEDLSLPPIADIWPYLSGLSEGEESRCRDPYELVKERDIIVRIVLDARSRMTANHDSNHRASAFGCEVLWTNSVIPAIPQEPQRRRNGFRPLRTFVSKLRSSVVSLGSRITFVVRPPYLPVWP